MSMKDVNTIRPHLTNYLVVGKSYRIFSHGLDESFNLYWDLSVTEQVQAVSVKEMTISCSNILPQVEELEEK